MGRLIDLTGATIGDWSISSRVGDSLPVRWACTCVCGSHRDVLANDLNHGRSTGCGCRQYAELTKRLTKHGHAPAHGGSPTYETWKHMTARCRNPKHKDYKYYGARGISVCTQWLDFKNFLADMGERPARMTIERTNTNGNYEPSNCIWATQQDQIKNRRSHAETGYITPNGECCKSSKLTWEQVDRIRALQGVMSQSKIGEMFGVTQTAISFIHRGATWKR